MQVTPLELGLAAAAVVVVFGPKKFTRNEKRVKEDTVDLSALRASQHAAGRAPSPLSMRDATPVFVSDKQYSATGVGPQSGEPSMLPHEYSRDA